MSEPLTREELEVAHSLGHDVPGLLSGELGGEDDLLGASRLRWAMRAAIEALAKTKAERDALEKQHAADLEAQQAAMLKCIREERVSKHAERDTLRARIEQLEQLYSHKDLDFECAESGCKSKKLTARCEQLEAALHRIANCGYRNSWPSKEAAAILLSGAMRQEPPPK